MAFRKRPDSSLSTLPTKFDSICCKICRSLESDSTMMLCDKCNTGWHTTCLSPPLREVPAGDWFCSDCSADVDAAPFKVDHLVWAPWPRKHSSTKKSRVEYWPAMVEDPSRLRSEEAKFLEQMHRASDDHILARFFDCKSSFRWVSPAGTRDFRTSFNVYSRAPANKRPQFIPAVDCAIKLAKDFDPSGWKELVSEISQRKCKYGQRIVQPAATCISRRPLKRGSGLSNEEEQEKAAGRESARQAASAEEARPEKRLKFSSNTVPTVPVECSTGHNVRRRVRSSSNQETAEDASKGKFKGAQAFSATQSHGVPAPSLVSGREKSLMDTVSVVTKDDEIHRVAEKDQCEDHVAENRKVVRRYGRQPKFSLGKPLQNGPLTVIMASVELGDDRELEEGEEKAGVSPSAGSNHGRETLANEKSRKQKAFPRSKGGADARRVRSASNQQQSMSEFRLQKLLRELSGEVSQQVPTCPVRTLALHKRTQSLSIQSSTAPLPVPSVSKAPPRKSPRDYIKGSERATGSQEPPTCLDRNFHKSPAKASRVTSPDGPSCQKILRDRNSIHKVQPLTYETFGEPVVCTLARPLTAPAGIILMNESGGHSSSVGVTAPPIGSPKTSHHSGEMSNGSIMSESEIGFTTPPQQEKRKGVRLQSEVAITEAGPQSSTISSGIASQECDERAKLHDSEELGTPREGRTRKNVQHLTYEARGVQTSQYCTSSDLFRCSPELSRATVHKMKDASPIRNSRAGTFNQHDNTGKALISKPDPLPSECNLILCSAPVCPSKSKELVSDDGSQCKGREIVRHSEDDVQTQIDLDNTKSTAGRITGTGAAPVVVESVLVCRNTRSKSAHLGLAMGGTPVLRSIDAVEDCTGQQARSCGIILEGAPHSVNSGSAYKAKSRHPRQGDGGRASGRELQVIIDPSREQEVLPRAEQCEKHSKGDENLNNTEAAAELFRHDAHFVANTSQELNTCAIEPESDQPSDDVVLLIQPMSDEPDTDVARHRSEQAFQSSERQSDGKEQRSDLVLHFLDRRTPRSDNHESHTLIDSDDPQGAVVETSSDTLCSVPALVEKAAEREALQPNDTDLEEDICMQGTTNKFIKVLHPKRNKKKGANPRTKLGPVPEERPVSFPVEENIRIPIIESRSSQISPAKQPISAADPEATSAASCTQSIASEELKLSPEQVMKIAFGSERARKGPQQLTYELDGRQAERPLVTPSRALASTKVCRVDQQMSSMCRAQVARQQLTLSVQSGQSLYLPQEGGAVLQQTLASGPAGLSRDDRDTDGPQEQKVCSSISCDAPAVALVQSGNDVDVDHVPPVAVAISDSALDSEVECEHEEGSNPTDWTKGLDDVLRAVPDNPCKAPTNTVAAESDLGPADGDHVRVSADAAIADGQRPLPARVAISGLRHLRSRRIGASSGRKNPRGQEMRNSSDGGEGLLTRHAAKLRESMPSKSDGAPTAATRPRHAFSSLSTGNGMVAGRVVRVSSHNRANPRHIRADPSMSRSSTATLPAGQGDAVGLDGKAWHEKAAVSDCQIRLERLLYDRLHNSSTPHPITPSMSLPQPSADTLAQGLQNTLIGRPLASGGVQSGSDAVDAPSSAAAAVPSNGPRVCVIGGGAAGLTAARQLLNACPGASVVIVEARDRLGGRMQTDKLPAARGLPEARVDLGAAFVHGCNDPEDNPVYLLAVKHQFDRPIPPDGFRPLLDRSGGGYSIGWADSEDGTWYHTDGSGPVSRQIVTAAFRVWDKARKRMLRESSRLWSLQLPDVSLREAFDRVVRNAKKRERWSTTHEDVLKSAEVVAWAYVGDMDNLSLKTNIPTDSVPISEQDPDPGDTGDTTAICPSAAVLATRSGVEGPPVTHPSSGLVCANIGVPFGVTEASAGHISAVTDMRCCGEVVSQLSAERRSNPVVVSSQAGGTAKALVTGTPHLPAAQHPVFSSHVRPVLAGTAKDGPQAMTQGSDSTPPPVASCEQSGALGFSVPLPNYSPPPLPKEPLDARGGPGRLSIAFLVDPSSPPRLAVPKPHVADHLANASGGQSGEDSGVKRGILVGQTSSQSISFSTPGLNGSSIVAHERTSAETAGEGVEAAALSQGQTRTRRRVGPSRTAAGGGLHPSASNMSADRAGEPQGPADKSALQTATATGVASSPLSPRHSKHSSSCSAAAGVARVAGDEARRNRKRKERSEAEGGEAAKAGPEGSDWASAVARQVPEAELVLSDDGLVVEGYGDMMCSILAPKDDEIKQGRVQVLLKHEVRAVIMDPHTGRCTVHWTTPQVPPTNACPDASAAVHPDGGAGDRGGGPTAVDEVVGAAGGKEVEERQEFDYVVVTLPLGVLQRCRPLSRGPIIDHSEASDEAHAPPPWSRAQAAPDDSATSARPLGTGGPPEAASEAPGARAPDVPPRVATAANMHRAAESGDSAQAGGGETGSQAGHSAAPGGKAAAWGEGPVVRFELAGGGEGSLFSEAKWVAIERLGMGCENKIVLRFLRPFWPLDHRHTYINCTDRRFRLLNLHRYGKTGIIAAHVSLPWSRGFPDDEKGSITSRPFALMKDEEVVTTLVRVLAGMFPGEAPSATGSQPASAKALVARAEELRALLVDFRVTRWEQDRFSMGSYSYMKKGSTFEDVTWLRRAEPEAVAGPVFMAGEACAPPQSMQCVHGAVATGRAAADGILQAWARRLAACPPPVGRSLNVSRAPGSG